MAVSDEITLRGTFSGDGFSFTGEFKGEIVEEPDPPQDVTITPSYFEAVIEWK